MNDGLTITTTAAVTALGTLVACISGLFAMLIKSKEREYLRTVADLKESKENFEKLAAESLTFATQQANWAMQQQNLPPVVLTAPVVPRSQSPSTAKQRETARLETMVATLAQLKLMMGVAASPTPPQSPQSHSESVREEVLEQISKSPHSIVPQVVVSPGVLSAARTAPKQILVIEDEPATCELMLARSSNMNCRLSFAGNGVEGLKIALNQNWHAILVDIGLPGLSGFEVLRVIREEKPNFVQLAAISGSWSPQMLQSLKQTGCLLFITKPEDFTDAFFDSLWRTFGVDVLTSNPQTVTSPATPLVYELSAARDSRAQLAKAIADVPDLTAQRVVEKMERKEKGKP